jgi:hypothetical protein
MDVTEASVRSVLESLVEVAPADWPFARTKLDELLSKLDSGDAAFWSDVTSGNFWGGMGSFVDCFVPSDVSHRRKSLELFIQLHKALKAAGHPAIEPHSSGWCEIFQRWLEDDVI